MSLIGVSRMSFYTQNFTTNIGVLDTGYQNVSDDGISKINRIITSTLRLIIASFSFTPNSGGKDTELFVALLTHVH